MVSSQAAMSSLFSDRICSRSWARALRSSLTREMASMSRPPRKALSVAETRSRISWPFQAFHTPGPTARISATVRISSKRNRSGVSTIWAKLAMVCGSETSRFCA